MTRLLAYALWASLAGALIPVVALLNVRLGRALGEPLQAPLVLFIVGLAGAILASTVLSGGLPDYRLLGRASPADFAGGLIMLNYIFMVTLLAPRLGIGTVILLAVTAQVLTSAAIDHYGWLGAASRPLGSMRLAGIGLVLAGLGCAQLAGSGQGAVAALP